MSSLIKILDIKYLDNIPEQSSPLNKTRMHQTLDWTSLGSTQAVLDNK
ncbi:MAG: hypothetical protein HRT91_04350 [Piscirickettsiaceae bacterium]|nr:hypothetical protein [Piscirickettsiaceae bacterium]